MTSASKTRAASLTPRDLRDAAADSFARWCELGDLRDLEISQALEQRARELENGRGGKLLAGDDTPQKSERVS